MRSVSRPTSALTARRARRCRLSRPLTRCATRGAADHRAPAAIEQQDVDEPRRLPPRLQARATSTAARAERNRREQHEQQDAAAVAVEADGAQPRFDPRQRATDEPHRMRGIDRVAHDQVGDDAERPATRRIRRERANELNHPCATSPTSRAPPLGAPAPSRRRSHMAAAWSGTRAIGGPAPPDSPRALPPAAPSHRRRPTPGIVP